jgi:hypothetical protein
MAAEVQIQPAEQLHGLPQIKYDDVLVSYDRIHAAHAPNAWPPRKHLTIPEFTKDATPDEIVAGLREVGGVIVRGILSKESLTQIEKDIRPHLEADTPWEADDGFFPPSTRRAFGLVGKSRTAALELIGNELYQAVCDQFLTSKAYKWFGHASELNVSKPQVNNTIAFSIRPGNSFAQPLHRDDDIHYAGLWSFRIPKENMN